MTPDHRPTFANRSAVRFPLRAGALVLAAWLGVSACSAGAFAQSLPSEAVTASQLSEQQKEQINAFASATLGKLKGANPADREAARDALIEPLEASGVTLAFRLALATPALTKELGAIAASPDDHMAFNALRVAGKLGTPQGVDIVRNGLADKRPAVRAGAARTMRETIRSAVTAAQSPINKSKLENAVDSLAAALEKESDPIVAKGLVLALDAPRAGATAAFGELHARAMEKMAEALAGRLKSVSAGADGAGWSDAALSGVDAVKGTFIDVSRAQFAGAAGLKKQAATLCGQAMGWVRARVAGGAKSDAADAKQLVGIASVAESTLILMDGRNIPQTLGAAVTTSLEAGSPSAVNAATDEWFGRLGAAPVSLDAKQFRKN
jgi:hypothetical protein